jgi:glycosyltransferase involved in cell wall biosynthesis
VRIGVDVTSWSNARGYGRFAREIVAAMVRLAPEHEFVLLADASSFDACSLDARNTRRVVVDVSAAPSRAAAADGYRSPADLLRMSRAVWREPLDVFFAPTVYSYFPLPPGLPAVVTVHDAIAERFPGLTLPSPRARLFWRAKVKLALLQSRLVLTTSEYARRELVRVLGIAGSCIRVSGEAPAAAYRPSAAVEVRDAARRAGLPEQARWFAYVGGFNPHKRVDAILRAHAALARGRDADAPHLLLVGTTSADVFLAEVPRLRALVESLGTGAFVHWTGYVPDDELRHLLTGATALVLPSESEGFGLPAVEAAACGTPVIATRESPLPELLAGGGYFVAPGDDVAIHEAMRALVDEPGVRDTLGCRALEQARAMSWERAGRVALDALQEAAA